MTSNVFAPNFPASPTSQYLQFTFRKLISKNQQLNSRKINIKIICNTYKNRTFKKNMKQKKYSICEGRKIKNGIACFYGESIQIEDYVESLSFIVELLKTQTNQIEREIATFSIDEENIEQLYCRKLNYVSSSEELQLYWEVQYVKQNLGKQLNYEDRSVEQDFQQIESIKDAQTERCVLKSKLFEPRREQRKRSSHSRMKKDKNKYQLASESPNKNTNQTTETSGKGKKKVMMIEPIKKKQNNCSRKIRTEGDQQQRSSQKNSFQLQKQKIVFSHPIFATVNKKIQPPPIEMTESKIFKNSTILKQKITPLTPRKKAQKLFDKLNLQNLIYSSIIGIIGGMAATQF